MKKAKTNKKRLGETYTFRFLNWILSTYYKLKYKYFPPDTTGQIKDGLYPATPTQQVLIGRAYLNYIMEGKSKRQARKLILRKFAIKVIPEGK